jgi:hypothetical protein
MSKSKLIIAAVLMAGAAACSDTTSPASRLALSLTNAFSATPAGFNQMNSSFVASGGMLAFVPDFHRGAGGPFEGGPFDRRKPAGLGLMGGGLGGAFFGDGIGAGFGRGPFGDGRLQGNCTFSSSTGFVTCDPISIGGLTIQRSAKYTDAAGQAQASVDGTTNTINTQLSVTGTITRRDSSTSTINESSNQTVTGLAQGSTQRTINGTSGGTEGTNGHSAKGTFTALRTVGDTTTGVVIPIGSEGHPSYPTAGTIIRSMNVTVTLEGESPASSSRREVITYDGSATASVVITHDGETKTCTLPLPRGHLTCQ